MRLSVMEKQVSSFPAFLHIAGYHRREIPENNTNRGEECFNFRVPNSKTYKDVCSRCKNGHK